VTTPIDSYTSAFEVNAAASLSQMGKMHSNAPLQNSPADRKLRKAAGEFESLLLSSLWKSMKSTFAAPDDDSTDPAHDTLENWGTDAMAGAVGKAGGLGLGKLILKHLEPLVSQSQAAHDGHPGKVSAPLADTSY
jgi:Rod binding domain-containing protein